MKHLLKIMLLVSVAALVAGSAEARQDKDGPRGRDGQAGRGGQQHGAGRFVEQMLKPKQAEQLGLDAAQITALTSGLEAIKEREKVLREELKEAGKKQAKLLMSKDEVDEAAVMRAIEKTGAIRTEMAKLRVQPIFLVKKTLTPEQIEMAREAIQKQRGGKGKGRGGQGGQKGRRGGPDADE